jgi:hypothetical protein
MNTLITAPVAALVPSPSKRPYTKRKLDANGVWMHGGGRPSTSEEDKQQKRLRRNEAKKEARENSNKNKRDIPFREDPALAIHVLTLEHHLLDDDLDALLYRLDDPHLSPQVRRELEAQREEWEERIDDIAEKRDALEDSIDQASKATASTIKPPRTIETIETTLILPKQLSTEELFEKVKRGNAAVERVVASWDVKLDESDFERMTREIEAAGRFAK